MSFLRRVTIKDYKSIGQCVVEPGSLTLIVGRNAAGKSNFLDALRFVLDGLQTSLDHAIRSRGGIDEVRRRSQGHPRNLAIALEFNLTDSRAAKYQFEIAAKPKGGFAVKKERVVLIKASGERENGFSVVDGHVSSDVIPSPHPPAPDRLYLVTASGHEDLREVYEALASMGFYNLNPERMKAVQSPDAGELLRHDGSNLPSVIARLEADRPDAVRRVKEYLQSIVPDVSDFHRLSLGNVETVQFRQQIKGANYPWKFNAASMSDGTLRALGILIATMQLADREHPVNFVGLEEPETALHPAASSALMDALREAGEHTQVIVTTHSADLLENFDAEQDTLLVAQTSEGETRIAPVDEASLTQIRSHLFTAGELLRMDQLQPANEAIEYQRQMFADSEV